MNTKITKVLDFIHKQKQTGFFFNYFIIGTLALPFSPFICIVFYSLFLIITIISYDFRNIKREHIPFAILFSVFSVWMLLRTPSFWESILHSIKDPLLFPVTVIDYLLFFIAFFFFIDIRANSKHLRRISWFLCLSSISIFFLAICEKYLGINDYFFYYPSKELPLINIYFSPSSTWRTQAGMLNPNILGMYCVLLFGPSLGLFFQEIHNLSKKFKREKDLLFSKKITIQLSNIFFIFISLTLNLIVLSWSGSRSAFVGTFFLLIGFIVLSKSKFLILSTASLGITLSCAIIFKINFLTSLIQQYIPNSDLLFRLTKINDFSNNHRMEIYDCAIQLIREKPFIGWEIGVTAFECQNRLGMFTNHAHNILLQLGSEIGLPFTILISLTFLFIVIKTAIQLISSHFLNKYHINDIYVLAGFYLGAIAIILMNIFSVAILHSYKFIYIFAFFLAIAFANLTDKKISDQ